MYGTLECGTQDQPYGGDYNITIYGNKPAAGAEQGDRVGGDKSVAVLNGGVLSLHGKKLSSWTRLSKTANVGDGQIEVFDAGDWQVGDQLVIATTANWNSADPNTAMISNEVVTIASINGNKIGLTEPLRYLHLSYVYDLGYAGMTLKKQVSVHRIPSWLTQCLTNLGRSWVAL